MDGVLQPLTFPASCCVCGEGVVYSLVNGQIELALNSSGCKNALATLITTYEAVQGISSWPYSEKDGTVQSKVIMPYNLLIGNLSKLPTSLDLVALNYFESHMLDVPGLAYEIWLSPIPCSNELLSCCWRCDVVPKKSHNVLSEEGTYFSSVRFILGWNGIATNFLENACPSNIYCSILVPLWKAPLIQYTRANLLQKLTSEHILDVIKAAAFNGYRLIFIADKPLETFLMFADVLHQALQLLRNTNVQRDKITHMVGNAHTVGNASPMGGNANPMGGNANPMGGNANPMGGNANPMGGNASPKLLLAGLPVIRRILAVMDTSLVLYDKGGLGNLADAIQPQTPHCFLRSGCFEIETCMSSLMHKMTNTHVPLLFLLTEASRVRSIMASIPKPGTDVSGSADPSIAETTSMETTSMETTSMDTASMDTTSMQPNSQKPKLKKWPLPLVQVSDITTFSDSQLTELFTECADFKTIIVDFQEAGRMGGRREYPAFSEIAVHEVVYERGFPENLPPHISLQMLRNEPTSFGERHFDDAVYNAALHVPMDDHVLHVSSSLDHFEPVRDQELKEFIQSALATPDDPTISPATSIAVAKSEKGLRPSLKMSLFNFFDTTNFLANRTSDSAAD